MKRGKKSRIATLMVHTSPLDQAGVGDAGGMNVYVVESAKKMAAAGLEVDIFTRANKPNLPESIEIADGVNVKHLVAGPFEGLSKEELPSQLGALTSAFMQHQNQLPNNYYQLLHSHYWISGQLGWVISEQTSIPLIHTMHTTAKVKNLNLAQGEKPEPQIRAIGEEQVVKAATGLIANTDAEAASLVSLYGACPDNVFVVAPGVDLTTYNPADGKANARQRLDIAPDAIMLTFVGRIQPHKGPDVLLRAAAQMVEHTPHLRAKLAVVIMGGSSGGGANELDNLKALAKFLKIDDVVHFIQPVAHLSLADWYRASDLVCVPSYSESFGLVALEAQACGTPVVATAVGGLRTAVSDGISGALIDGHNPMAWATVILKIVSDPIRSVKLSISSLEHASKFGWQVTANRTLKIYDDLVGMQSKSSFIPRFIG